MGRERAAMHRMKMASLLCTVICWSLVVEPVRADEQESGLAHGAAESDAAAHSRSQTREQQALGLLARARVLYADGDFDAAIVLLERAYELAGSSRYVFNLGAAHHGAGHCELARGYYEEYLRREPRGSERAAASTALEEIYSNCGRSHRPDMSRHVAGWVLLGVGAGAAIATVGSLGMMLQAQSDFRERATPGVVWNAREVAALEANGKRYESMAWVLGLSSLVLLATGTTMLVLDQRQEASVSVAVDRISLGLRYQQRF